MQGRSLDLFLKGFCVLVTRPVHQAEDLTRQIVAAGGKAVLFPTIDIQEVFAASELTQTLEALEKTNDIFIFVSHNAAVRAAPHLSKGTKYIIHLAIGSATQKTLERFGISVDNVPEVHYNSRGLLALPELQYVQGKKITIFSGEQGNTLLADTLKERGAEVFKLAVYRRACPRPDNVEFDLAAWESDINLVVTTSYDGLVNLTHLLGEKGLKWLAKVPLLVVSNKMRRFARECNIGKPILMAETATVAGILNCLKKWGDHG